MNYQVTITTDHVEQFETENPAQVIARVIGRKPRAADQKLPPLTGGLAGYILHTTEIKYVEPTLRLDAEIRKVPDVDLMLV